MIQTKQDLINFIKEELGSDVLEIEVSDKQISNQINKTIQKFCKFAFEGFEEKIIILPIKKGIQKYPLPEKFIAVYDVLENSQYTLNSVFNEISLFKRNITKNFVFGDEAGLQYYIVGMQYIDLLKNLFKYTYMFEFDSISNTINFKNTIKKDKTIAISGAVAKITENNLEDSNFISNIFNHEWVKSYATALTRYIWGMNLSKYQTNLPGGTTINSDLIVNEAKEQIEKLEEELYTVYDPPMFFFQG